MTREQLIDLDILADRAGTLPTDPAVIERIQNWIEGMRAYESGKPS